jgi:hypothetical protein
MDYLIDQAVQEKYNSVLLPYNTIGACKINKAIQWTNVTLESIFSEKNIYKVKQGNRVIQVCKNLRCVNQNHLREVNYETWFKNGLEAELMWMDFV